MKFLFLIFFLSYNILVAQYKIEYDYNIYVEFPGNISSVTTKSFLITDGFNQSRYVKNRVVNGNLETNYKNSIKEMEDNDNSKKNHIKGDSIGYVIIKKIQKDSIYMRMIDSKGHYCMIPRKLVKFDYTIFDEYKEILGYNCQKAIFSYEERNFEIWFTSEIPINDGPWILQGLPGIILQAKTTDGFHEFIATSIKKIPSIKESFFSFPYKYLTDLTTYQNEYIKNKEKQFKYNKSQEGDAKITLKINNLDIPLTFFE
ncbi:GLPGLI family protein [Flavobacterium sp. TP390]|uniref:GLPGLI family protein n=1 Tax=Flavobacterium profundi TaxID=1774945 RepID=A0A6I4ITA4_9FLAO|nr:GLPGLI family protein [Flavobacterium profundi]MVO10048.1 GLPGLI family protein [Flavobacterium profundi]